MCVCVCVCVRVVVCVHERERERRERDIERREKPEDACQFTNIVNCLDPVDRPCI